MSSIESQPAAPSSGHRCFATTRWSVVLASQQPGTTACQAAMETLCEIYWYPLYAYVRRQGYQEAEAQDLTQAFFARLLEKRDLDAVARERGKFRSFLLASLKHFLSNQRDYQRAACRGGGQTVLSLDFAQAEQWYQHQRVDQRTAEAEFERQWALTLLNQVRDELGAQWADAGKGEAFAVLCKYLTGTPSGESYRQASERLGMSEGAVKTAVCRLRQQYGQLLREHIAPTLADGEAVEDEIRQLFEALRR